DPTAPDDIRTEFIYDGLGRLRDRVEYNASPSAPLTWVKISETHYIYDGFRVIQERAGLDGDNTPTVSYTRGSDLSGTLEGAGGIGGLLARSHDFTICSNLLTVRITNGLTVSETISISDNSQTY